MSPATHFLTGWVIATAAGLGRRERAIVAACVVIPDVDGLGIVPELLTRHSSHPLLWFSEYHHALHTLSFSVTVAIAAFWLSGRLWKSALLALAAFHIHLFEDLIGSRGPDGYPWPIPYLSPFTSAGSWTWSGQWALNAWPNILLTCVLLVLAVWFAARRGYSPVDLISSRADAAVVDVLRHRLQIDAR